MRILWLLMIGICMPHIVMARIGSVPHSDVRQGAISSTWRNQYTLDNDSSSQHHAFRTRLTLDAALTEDYAMWTAIEGRNVQGESAEITRIFWDHRFEFTTMQQEGFYSGVRLRYEMRAAHAADITHIRFILGKEVGAWDLRFNQIIGTELGAERQNGVFFDTRFHVAYRYHPEHAVGLESFHQLGSLSQQLPFSAQAHYVGPTFFGAITHGVRYEAGYMAGISRAAPDHAFYLGFTRDF